LKDEKKRVKLRQKIIEEDGVGVFERRTKLEKKESKE